MKFKVGDVCVLKGCSQSYQLENLIPIKFCEKRTVDLLLDGVIVKSSYYSYSTDGICWYPENTLEINDTIYFVDGRAQVA